MSEITELKKKIEASGLVMAQNDALFELLAVACSGCCQVSNGGNGGCPPIKEAE
jgi:hypothetical protein